MECARVCELDAVFHNDSVRHFEIGAQTILRFPSSDLRSSTPAGKAGQEATIEGVHTISPGSNGELASQLTKAMAMALEAANEIEPKKGEETRGHDLTELDTDLGYPLRALEQSAGSKGIGVFLCRCGGSISSVVNLELSPGNCRIFLE